MKECFVGHMIKWPNFFIVGAPRSGTTSLYEYLNEVPGVFMSTVKEPNYFNPSVNDDLFLSKPIKDEKKYLNLFKNVKDEIAIGEASPTYLWDPKTPKLIHEVIPDAKIIISLRDPITRAFSEYLLLSGLGSVKGSFLNTITKSIQAKDYSSGRIIQNGLYYEQVKRYVNTFTFDQIKVIIFEELVQDTWKLVKQVLDFLEVKHDPPHSVTEIHNAFTLPKGQIASTIVGNKVLRKMGKTLLPRKGLFTLRKILTKKTIKPQMSIAEKNHLKEFYRDDVIKLQTLLNCKFPWEVLENID